MYDIALVVGACLRSGTRVDVAWPVATIGFPDWDPAEALALTPGGGHVGSVLSGAADDALAELARSASRGRLVPLTIGEYDARRVGFGAGGSATCVLTPAADLPAELWPHLDARRPVCLVLDVVDGTVTSTAVFTAETIEQAGPQAAALFAGGRSAALVEAGRVTTVLHPVPALLLLGRGEIARALADVAGAVGWKVHATDEAGAAIGLLARLSPLDSVVVMAHDVEVAGPALKAALESSVGYIGALGGRPMQAARADWLAGRDVTDLTRVHGPAGLDLGARTPQEVALSIVAEAVAVRSGASGGSLRATPQ